jgi:PKD repeat protein
VGRISERPRFLAQGALVAVGLLVAAVLSAPAATAADPAPPPGVGDLRPAPAAYQPTLLRRATPHPKTASAARQASSADVSVASASPPCDGVTIAPGTAPSGYQPLTSGLLVVLSDEANATFSVPRFRWVGQDWTTLQVDSNGYVQPGDDSTVQFHNQNLPDAAPPNNVLAPYWTDLDPNFTFVRIAVLTNGTGDYWIVVDWNDVPDYGDPFGSGHSFEVWIGVEDLNPGEDISFVYGPNTDIGLESLTVGAENDDGTAGKNAYFSPGTGQPPEGTLPSEGTQLRVSSTPPYGLFSATPSRGRVPLQVEFDASASSDPGGITGATWDFGDGTTGTGIAPTHVYTTGGSYTATLTVTDNENNTCHTSKVVTVEGGFSVNDVTVNESAGTATFTVSRSGGPDATVDVSATAVSATTPADFTAAPTTLVFNAGDTSRTFDVSINQDALDESTENYVVNLFNANGDFVADAAGTGTIMDDDPAVRLSITDASVSEGNSGTRNLSFQVRLDRASGKQVRVSVHTTNGSARAPGDYRAANVVLTFAPGQTVQTVPVVVVGDRTHEPNETLSALLSNPVNATISDASGTGRILNDD